MNGLRLAQLVPPGEGGVRDHAEVLRAHWAGGSMPSLLIELSQAGAREQPLLQRLAAAPSQPAALLVHFSGYGYQRRGLCGWLLRALQQLRARLGSRLRLVTLFHELFAGGPPWRSAFWLGPWQAALAARLARMSDAVVTNSQAQARWLAPRLAAGAALETRPVFSNVGEPALSRPWQGREGGLVIFGSAATRARALRGLAPHAGRLPALGVTQVLQAGGGDAGLLPPLLLPQQHLGRLDAAELSQLLQRHRFGLIDYPWELLGKSGVFAAYAAHGNLVINTQASGSAADGLQPGHHFLSLADGPRRGQTTAASALALHGWYREHRAEVQAQRLLSLLADRPIRTTASPLPLQPPFTATG